VVDVKTRPLKMKSVWDSLIAKMSRKLVDQYSMTGNINAADVEKLNRLKDKRDEANRI